MGFNNKLAAGVKIKVTLASQSALLKRPILENNYKGKSISKFSVVILD